MGELHCLQNLYLFENPYLHKSFYVEWITMKQVYIFCIMIFSVCINAQYQKADSLIVIASEKFESDDYAGAMMDIQTILTQDSTNILALFNAAVIQIQLSNYNDAIQYLNRAILLDSMDTKSIELRAQVYKKMGETFKAEMDYKRSKIIGLSRIKVVAFIDSDTIAKGDSLCELGLFKEAIDTYTRVIEVSPHNFDAIAGRGYAYLQMDSFKRALSDYSNAILIDSSCFNCYSNRGLIKYYLNDIPGAINDCETAIFLNRRYEYAYFHLAICYQYEEEYNKALKNYNKAIRLDRDYALAIFNRGVLYDYMDNQEKACEDWRKAYKKGYYKAENYILKYCK